MLFLNTILISLLFVAGTFAGIPAAASETEYIYADMAGFESYTRVILAMVGISGAKSPQPVSVDMPGAVEGKSVRVTAIAGGNGENGISISSCRTPDTSFADSFKDGAHLNPTASGKTYNVFDGAVLTDSVGVRFCVATGASGSVAAVSGRARVQLGVTPSRGRSTADIYAEYDEGFVFETPEYEIGADGFVNVPFESAVPVDNRTPADADFLHDYLPLVNAVNVIITPDGDTSARTAAWPGSPTANAANTTFTPPRTTSAEERSLYPAFPSMRASSLSKWTANRCRFIMKKPRARIPTV